MNEITNIDGFRSAAPAASGSPSTAPPEGRRVAGPGATPEDRVELSELGRLLAAARDLPDIRMEKVVTAREQIRTGTYETPDKIAITVDRLLADLAG